MSAKLTSAPGPVFSISPVTRHCIITRNRNRILFAQRREIHRGSENYPNTCGFQIMWNRESWQIGWEMAFELFFESMSNHLSWLHRLRNKMLMLSGIFTLLGVFVCSWDPCAKACHASMAAMWLSSDDPTTQDYCSPENIDHMHKVCTFDFSHLAQSEWDCHSHVGQRHADIHPLDTLFHLKI
jgi:hypothetical protein